MHAFIWEMGGAVEHSSRTRHALPLAFYVGEEMSGMFAR